MHIKLVLLKVFCVTLGKCLDAIAIRTGLSLTSTKNMHLVSEAFSQTVRVPHSAQFGALINPTMHLFTIQQLFVWNQR